LGLIAQDVEKIISEIVNVKDDEAKTLGISYTELIPVLINAIKEQQEIIDDQKKEILYLSANAIKRDQSFNLINERLNQLEKKINQ
ncbi:MAG: hypothetical protein HKO67_08070, partial [Flavobacteriaceae bacterium]|nr:hypothetical protein [Flavobacteriaceae bacterium]